MHPWHRQADTYLQTAPPGSSPVLAASLMGAGRGAAAAPEGSPPSRQLPSSGQSLLAALRANGTPGSTPSSSVKVSTLRCSTPSFPCTHTAPEREAQHDIHEGRFSVEVWSSSMRTMCV
jgi:hypothetical protein